LGKTKRTVPDSDTLTCHLTYGNFSSVKFFHQVWLSLLSTLLLLLTALLYIVFPTCRASLLLLAFLLMLASLILLALCYCWLLATAKAGLPATAGVL
jgi:hypothetical protein